VTDGTWSVLDALYVFATNTTTTANLNLKSTSYGLSQVGSVSFSANNGYTGDGATGYFTTGFTPSTAGGQWGINSASLGDCVLTDRPIGSVYSSIGASDSLQDDISTILPFYSSSSLIYLNGYGVFPASSTSLGAHTASITSSSQGYTAINGSSTSFTPASINITTYGLYALALNGAGTASSFSADEIAYLFYGGGLSTTQITAVYDRLHTYLSTVGAASGC
jgi:hypothetical protein